jgi:methyl-accepting chemotaxis protein
MDESSRVVRDYIAGTSVRDSLQNIITAVEKTATLTQEIEAATSEQSAGAEQIARATQELAQLTQVISAATEEQSVGTSEIIRAMDQMHEAVRQPRTWPGSFRPRRSTSLSRLKCCRASSAISASAQLRRLRPENNEAHCAPGQQKSFNSALPPDTGSAQDSH